MSTIASRKISRTLSTLAVAALSVLGSSAMAEEELKPAARQWGIYAGGNIGVGAAQWDCDVACDRARLSGKVFGGKRLTPGLAAEINYMVFGGMNRSYGTPRADSVLAERRSVRALTEADEAALPLFVAVRQFWLLGEYAGRVPVWGSQAMSTGYLQRQVKLLTQWEALELALTARPAPAPGPSG